MKLAVPKLYFCLLLLWIGGFFLSILFPAPYGFYFFVTSAGLGGFLVAAKVRRVKKHKEQLVCPLGSDCNAVITSRYANFFGFPLELLGMAYFGIIFLTYLSLIAFSHLLPPTAFTVILMLTPGAFLFSSYLLFVQAFLLRQWCIWCLLAALFSYTIFFGSLINFGMAIDFLASIENFIELVLFLGFALGLGGATSAAFLFYRFLKDRDIDEKELDAIKGLSELIWLGVGLILVSQLTTYALYPDQLSQSDIFIARIISLFIIIFSGATLMIVFAPFLAYIPFYKDQESQSSALESLRKPVFIIGSVGLSSWYFAFVTNFIPLYSLQILLLAYLIFTFITAIAALFWESAYRTPTPN